MTRRRIGGVLAAALALLVLAATPAAAEVGVEATIAGRDVDTADSARPIRLEPRTEIPLEVTLHNTGDEPVDVRYVRLEGEALGLTFLTYDLGIRLRLAPGETQTVEAPLDFFDLDSQATGYLGTSLRVYDTERRVLAHEDFVVDVRGKATSTLGLFAIAVLFIAALSVAVLAANTVRRRLPPNRFVRGLQFAIAGAAIGLTLALGVSIMRLAFVDVEAWVPLVFAPTAIGFALGYIAPGPLSQSIQEVREEEKLQVYAEEAVVRASGAHTAQVSGAHDRVSHPSGGWVAAGPPTHDSGRHTPHESGSFPSHESGGHEPRPDASAG